MDKKCEIYKLIDPRTEEIRYVGQTHCGLKTRLNKHIREARYQNKTKNHKWINSLIKDGCSPVIELLEIVDFTKHTWQEREIFWIEELSKMHSLNNHSLGGDGTLGFSPTLEMRKAVSEANKRRIWTEESRKKASESHKKHVGWHHSFEARKNMSRAHKGKIISEETKKKMSEAQKKRAKREHIFTEEQVVEIRLRWQNGEKINKLAKEFGIYRHTMSNLVKGITDNVRKHRR